MYGRENPVLLREYLEQGLTKTALAVKLGLSRRTIHQLDRIGVAGPVSGQRGGALQEATFDAA